MALDTGGNQAVDYVWGNTPMQPDTDRATTIADLTYNASGAGYNPGGFQYFDVFSPTTPELAVGDTFDVTGAPVYALNTTYTVSYVGQGVNGFVVETTTPNGIFASWGLNETVTLIKGASGNFGGGNGDAGWSKTTKKRSVKLNPALDGHNIATEFWNNFPGYTPNAGFIPQQVWQGTILGAPGAGAYITEDSVYGTSDAYGDTKHGYIIMTYGAALSEEDSDSLYTAITTGALVGERVPGFSVWDNYGNQVPVPMGHIVGADYDIVYGVKEFSIRVAVDNFTFMNYLGLPAGQVLTLGLGAPKEVITNSVVGTDINSVVFVLDEYASTSYAVIYGPSNSYSDMSAELKALVGTDLSGGYIGMGIIGSNSNNGGPYSLKTNFWATAGSVEQYFDMYQTAVGIKIHLADVQPGLGEGQPFAGNEQGDTLVIIK